MVEIGKAQTKKKRSKDIQEKRLGEESSQGPVVV